MSSVPSLSWRLMGLRADAGLRVAATTSLGLRLPAVRLFSTAVRSRVSACALPVPAVVPPQPLLLLLRNGPAIRWWSAASSAPTVPIRLVLRPVRWSSTAFKQPPTYSQPHPPALKATPDSSTYPVPNAEPKPFNSVFGVENIAAGAGASAADAAAADAKAASSASVAAAAEIKTTLASGASTAHSPSTSLIA
jgi:hypothetical protein